MSFRRLIILILVVGVTACSSAPETPTAAPTLEIRRLQYTPALSWMEPIFNHCTAQQAETGLLVKEVSAPYLDLQDADILLRWGENGEIAGHAVVVGYDDLVVTVHPDNSIDSITLDDLLAIYTGQVSTWDEINPELPAEAISVWSYPEDSETRSAFEDTFQGHNPYTFIHLAPGPAEMRAAISENPQAIGYLPGRWLNENLRAVNIVNIDPDVYPVPILGITPVPPAGSIRNWLLCLQTEIST